MLLDILESVCSKNSEWKILVYVPYDNSSIPKEDGQLLKMEVS